MEGDNEMDAIYRAKNPASSYRNPGDFLLAGTPAGERSKKERILASLVLAAASVGLLFGYFNLTYRIKNPFDFLLNKNTTGEEQCVGGDCEAQQKLAALLALRAKDTDEEGLSDYDELYVHKTSPYLADSDSDGFTDKEEVDKGYDPNCPGKESCFSESGAATDGTITTPTFGTTPNTQMAGVTPDLVRQLLTQAGATPEAVAALSDSELMALFQEAAAENSDQINQWQAQASAGTEINTNSQPTTNSAVNLSQINITSIEDLKNLTGAQLRALMIQSGASENLLSQVSDEELKTMFLTKLNSQSN